MTLRLCLICGFLMSSSKMLKISHHKTRVELQTQEHTTSGIGGYRKNGRKKCKKKKRVMLWNSALNTICANTDAEIMH